MGPEVEKQPGKIERLCFAWGPTAHPPTIIGLSVRPYVNPYTQLSIHTSMHPLTHQAHEFKHHPLVYLPNPSTHISIPVFVHAHPIHSFLHPSLQTYPQNLSVCLSIRASWKLLLIHFILRTTHYETIMLALAHRVT